MNRSTVSGCGEIEHSENSRKSGQQKNPTARKQLDLSIKRTLKIGDCLCRLCAVHQRKKVAEIFLPQLFGGSWWIRKPRSKKQSAGLFSLSKNTPPKAFATAKAFGIIEENHLGRPPHGKTRRRRPPQSNGY